MSGLGRRRLKPSAWVEALEGELGFACLLRFFGAGARVVLDRWLRLGGLRQLAPWHVVFVRGARRRAKSKQGKAPAGALERVLSQALAATRRQ